VSRRSRRAGLFALLAGLAVLPACGIPLDATPNTIRGLPNNPPTPTSTVTGSSGSQKATIYYMQGARLRGVTRAVTNLSPATLLTLLVLEPTPGEADEKDGHIFNVLSPNDALGLGNPNASRGDLTVQLPPEIRSLEGSLLADAYGEIVYTLLDPANNHGCAYTGVLFTLDGQPLPALLPNFLLAAGRAVTRKDYLKIAPKGAAPPTTC
jgi:hypothetical protein